MKIIALLLQVSAIVGFIVAWAVGMSGSGYDVIRPTVSCPLCILVLSFVWSDWFQTKIAEPYRKDFEREGITARFKSCEYCICS